MVVMVEARDDRNFCDVMKMKQMKKKMEKRDLREEGGYGIFFMWDFLYFL